MLIRTRREFLQSSLKSITALGAMGAMAKFGEINAFASENPGYKALVYIFLTGGNDPHNTIIPISTDKQKYSHYQSARPPLALDPASLLQIANGKETYGLHPSLSEIQALYTRGNAAVLANVGNLVRPTTRDAYLHGNSVSLPVSLFSHSDQLSEWQSAVPSEMTATGWGGRMADVLRSQNSTARFPSISAIGGSSMFCTGKDTFPATISPPQDTATAGGGLASLNAVRGVPASGESIQRLLAFDNGLQLVQASNDILVRGNEYAHTLNGLLANVQLKTHFPPGGGLGAQLQTVAKVISLHKELGLTRQIFFCELQGFDSHRDQRETQKNLLAELSKAVAAFYQATQELSLEKNVVTFTGSEFGRTLSASGNDGSDHAWGSHHFVVGGDIQGGKFYGDYPLLAMGGDQDASDRGVLIPTTSVTQYGATLAKWFGVEPADMSIIFPTIGNFPSPTLSFLS